AVPAHGRTADLELDAPHFPCLRTYVQPTATGRRLCVSMPQLNQLWGDTYGPFLRRTGGTGAGPRRGGTRSAVSAVCPLRRPPTVDGRPRGLTPRSGQEIRSSNSPSLAPSRNASISLRVKTRTGPSGCREFLTATPAPPGRAASSTQLPLGPLRWLLRQANVDSSAAVRSLWIFAISFSLSVGTDKSTRLCVLFDALQSIRPPLAP